MLHAVTLRFTAFAVTFAATCLVAACTMASRPDLSGMSFASEPLTGKMIWYDLITEDIDAARRFYGGLFGWTFEESGTRGDDYLLARDGNVYVAGLVAAPGRVVWSELLADDPAAAAAFYRTVVGYAPRTVERRRGAYTFLAAAGKDRAGILENPSEEWEPLWLTYFGVEDPRAAAATAAELGGRIVLEPSPEIREGSMAVVTDPSGAVLVLQRWSAQQEAGR